ncbi:MAG: CHAT domain-containing protein, partial [Ilumatobacteraceae bacterium]
DVTSGRLYAMAGDAAAARQLLRTAASRRSRGPAPERAAAQLAMALVHESTGHRDAARRAVTDGLRTLLDNPATLGAIELRAHAIAHGNALAEVGARLAVADRRPRELLSRIEAARGMVALLPRPAMPDDPELARLLTELREINESFRDAVLGPEDRSQLAHRRSAVETAIRSRARRVRGVGMDTRLDLGDAIGELGDRGLLEYGLLDGGLWCVSVVRGRARMHEIGPIAPVLAEIDSVEVALNRLNRQQSSERSREAAVDTIRAAGRGLEELLVPSRVLDGAEPVVIVPTGRLHGLAWRALPAFAERSVSVSPSLFGWVASMRDGQRPIGTPVTLLVAGPQLAAAPAEVAALAEVHRHAVLLDTASSTAAACIEAMASATLAHFACHGAFRTDNPLFSSLRVADGELNLYDLEQCPTLPRTVVLSACNAAASTELRGGALLGMSNALMSLGVASVIAPLTPVNDERSVEVMVRLHTKLAAGVPPGEALAMAAVVDGDLDPTAAAFVAIGA